MIVNIAGRIASVIFDWQINTDTNNMTAILGPSGVMVATTRSKCVVLRTCRFESDLGYARPYSVKVNTVDCQSTGRGSISP